MTWTSTITAICPILFWTIDFACSACDFRGPWAEGRCVVSGSKGAACQCSPAFEVDCSDLLLDSVPKGLPEKLSVLILSSNNLTLLKYDDFNGCTRLKKLIVTNNRLYEIERDTFRDTLDLEDLHLDNNQLIYDEVSLPNAVFSSLKNLKSLSLHGNRWDKSSDYPKWVFAGIRNLRTLSLDGIPNVNFSQEFGQLVNLKKLTCSLYGGLNAVNNDTFQLMSSCPIEHLKIQTKTVLNNLEPLSFSWFKNLKILDLGFNMELSLKGAAACFYGLKYTNITDLILSRVTVVPGPEILESFFQYLIDSPNIKRLLLDKNNIVVLAKGFSKYLQNLRHFDISYNRMSDVQTLIYDIASMKKLRFVDASHQTKRYIKRRSLNASSNSGEPVQPESWKTEKLDSFKTEKPDRFKTEKPDNFKTEKPENFKTEKPDNFETEKPDSFKTEKPDNFETEKPDSFKTEKPDNLKTGKLENRKLHSRNTEKLDHRTTVTPENKVAKLTCETPPLKPCSLTGGIFNTDAPRGKGGIPLPDTGPWCMLLPPAMETLNLTASLNVDLHEIPQIVIFGGKHWRELVYRSNGVQEFAAAIFITTPNPLIPMTFDLSDNGMTCLAENLLNYSIQLGLNMGRFLLAGNNLAFQLEHETEGRMFRLYRNLSELSLAYNNIRTLPVRVFVSLLALRILNVSGNALRQIEFQFEHMSHLEILDVSNNLLTNLNAETLDKLSSSHRKSNLAVNLAGNPLQCSCESLPFLYRIQTNPSMFLNARQYSCLYRDKQVGFELLSSYILPDLSYRCKSQVITIVSAVLFLTTLITVAISICIYRHRWDIRYFCLRLATMRKSAQPERPKKYDVFVIYDKDDRLWVIDELLAHLENEPGDEERLDFSHGNRHAGGDVIGGNNAMERLSSRDLGDNETDEDTIGLLGAEQHSSSDPISLRFCIHERDFPPGEKIEENIISSIENSRKVLLVLSRSFSESQWCCYELELAKIASFDRGRNLLVPVLLEDLDMRKISRGLQSLLRQYTYIDWKEHRLNRREFWWKLRQALTERCRAYVCECERAII